MIKVDTTTRIPSVDEALGILRENNNTMPIFVDLDKILMDIGYLQGVIAGLRKPLVDVLGEPSKTDMSANLKTWLVGRHKDHLFNRVSTGISVDKDSIETAIESGGLTEDEQFVISVYQKYSNSTKVRGSLVSLLQNPMSAGISCDGHRMLIVKPEWVPQNTGRLGMSKPAIQNLPREVQDVITVPRGWVLLHTDSGQIEPRIVYSAYIKDPQIQALIRLYDDAYYGILHYITMPEEDRRSGRTDFTKNEITEALEKKRALIKKYSNAVMYGSKSNPSSDPIKAAMIEHIGKHPSRLEWVNSLRSRIEAGCTVFNTVFGTPIDTSNSKKLTYGASMTESVIEEKVKLAINNPIQGTAADLMRLSVYEANKLIINRSPKSYIVDYVHDAGTFAIYQDDLDKVKDELADIVSYDVEGWLPIKAEPTFGREGGKNGIIPDLY